MKTQGWNNTKKPILYVIMGILSAMVFCFVYGVRVLNPTYTAWLYNGVDLTQHYIGWKAYRLSAWDFPIGMIDNLSYPNKISVIYTDSIPLFAIPFKVISFLLPNEFQYFGIWGLLCYILQGMIAARILKRFIDNDVYVILASTMFLFVPVLFERMYYHTALSAHWVLLLGLEVILCWDSTSDKKRILKRIILIAVCSASIHIYFVLMSGMILLGIVLNNLLHRERIVRQILYVVIYIMTAAAVIFILGGFHGGLTSVKEGLGVYAFNLNGFFNPAGYVEGESMIFPNLPYLTEWPDEGYAYLGAGFIFLLVFGAGLLGGRMLGKKDRFLQKEVSISLFVLSVFSIAFAVSPRVGLGSYKIIEISLPQFLWNLWSIFRATGRVAWICMYILMLVTIIAVWLACKHHPRLVIIVIGIALLIQVYDLQQIIMTKHKTYSELQTHESALDDSFWEEIYETNSIKHIIYMSDLNVFEMFEIGNYALDHGMTTSDFYFARDNEEIESYRKNKILHPKDDEIFVFKLEDEVMSKQYHLDYRYADGYIIMGRQIR